MNILEIPGRTPIEASIPEANSIGLLKNQTLGSGLLFGGAPAPTAAGRTGNALGAGGGRRRPFELFLGNAAIKLEYLP